jgi:hypothetical protein
VVRQLDLVNENNELTPHYSLLARKKIEKLECVVCTTTNIRRIHQSLWLFSVVYLGRFMHRPENTGSREMILGAFYLPFVASPLSSDRFSYKTQPNSDVQYTKCLLDLRRICKLNETISSSFLKHGK